MNLQERLKLILNRPGVSKETQEVLLVDILREIEVYRTPMGSKRGITIMTPEASALDMRDPGKNPAKPKVL
jgi:hypothetical protein